MIKPIDIEKTITTTITQKDLECVEDTVMTFIESKLKRQMEGTFIKEGYVIPDSVNVIDISAGTVIPESLSADLHYIVMVNLQVIHPVSGDIIRAKIEDKNKMGIRMIQEPLDIILAYVHHSRVEELRDMNIGDELEVVVVASKYQIGDTKQSVIAIWKEDPNSKEYLVKET